MSGGSVRASVEGALLRVVIQRPEKRNALSGEILAGLADAFTRHAKDESLRVAVLRGAGDRSFAAGGDLRELASIRHAEGARQMAERAKAALDTVRHFPLPVIAALNGHALGGGAELALACDFRVARRGARIGFVQGTLNLSTAWGGAVDLAWRVGPSVALGLLCRSERIEAEDAERLGLVDAVGADGEDVDALAARFAEPFLRQAPQVLRAMKAVSDGARRGLPRSELYEIETRTFAETWVHDDHWAAAERLLAKASKP